MPVYRLTDDLIFPPVSGAVDGVVAVGGDLTLERLMLAYESGIFPWYSKGEPIIWWSPDPRFVLFPARLHVSRSMKRVLNSGTFKVTYNQDFEGVIANCQNVYRENQEGTWITEEMLLAYVRLHEVGRATSVEVWNNDKLVGGMYGVKVGNVFCGESMFSLMSNASKVALITFLQKFQQEGGQLLDCQVHSSHLQSLGAENIARDEFLQYL